MRKAWSNIEEVPYCFSMSYVKLRGPMAQKIVDFDPNYAFPDWSSSLSSPMDDAQTWCSKEEVPYYFSRPSIKFHGHSGWKIDALNPIWVRLLGRSQLSNPSDLPCLWRDNIHEFHFMFYQAYILILSNQPELTSFVEWWPHIERQCPLNVRYSSSRLPRLCDAFMCQ